MPIPPPSSARPTPSFNTASDILLPSASPSSSLPRPTANQPRLTPAPPNPTGPDQEVLYVNLDGSAYHGKWPPQDSSHAGTRKGKRRIEDVADIRARRASDGSEASNSLSSILKPRITYPNCNDAGNAVLSCWPIANTTVYQGDWTKFIWNDRIPDFIGLPGSVDIYLYHADSGALVERWQDIPNVQNEVDVLVNDSFWDYRMTLWQPGRQIPYTYYFVIVKSGISLTGGEPHQPTFTAVQTAFASSYYASLSSVASTSSVAAASLLSILGPTSASVLSASSVSRVGGAAETAGLQGGSDSGTNSFPAWAIALLVILGFLAFLSMAGLGYLLIRNYRRRHSNLGSRRHSMGSSTPMMGEVTSSPQSPVMGTSTGHQFVKGGPLAAAGGAVAVGAGATRSNSLPHGGTALNDAASTGSVSDAGPISGQDAQIMADAFRKALRKPDFGDRPTEEGESPDTNNNSDPKDQVAPVAERRDPVLSRELAEEGRDIRSVSSVRGVTVQGSAEDSSGEGMGTTTSRKPS